MSAASEIRSVERHSIWRNEFARGIILQAVVAGALLALAIFIVHNTAVNLAKRGIASGFGFLENIAGFQPTFSLIPFDLATSTKTSSPLTFDGCAIRSPTRSSASSTNDRHPLPTGP